jgi:hypothetical protein
MGSPWSGRFSMSVDFIDDLLDALQRIGQLDVVSLKEILIVCGVPEATQNLRYLNYNRQKLMNSRRDSSYSAVAVLNNRRASRWQLHGYTKKVSQVVFSTRWTRNPLDLFLNNLRCDPLIMEILASAETDYTLLGLLQIDDIQGSGIFKRRLRYVHPVLTVPGLDEPEQREVEAFEKNNIIKKARVKGVAIYRKVDGQLSCL